MPSSDAAGRTFAPARHGALPHRKKVLEPPDFHLHDAFHVGHLPAIGMQVNRRIHVEVLGVDVNAPKRTAVDRHDRGAHGAGHTTEGEQLASSRRPRDGAPPGMRPAR
jgi:hypothetical protein